MARVVVTTSALTPPLAWALAEPAGLGLAGIGLGGAVLSWAVALWPLTFAGWFTGDAPVATLAASALRFTGFAFGGFGLGMAMYFAAPQPQGSRVACATAGPTGQPLRAARLPCPSAPT